MDAVGLLLDERLHVEALLQNLDIAGASPVFKPSLFISAKKDTSLP